eukprot:m.83901 g.83901  ORF g.83901 m.83901 type:complete len:79 (-) comp14664_c0_seq17:306-542(-)
MLYQEWRFPPCSKVVGCLQGHGGPTFAYQQPESVAAWQRQVEDSLDQLDVIERTPEELCFDLLVPRAPCVALFVCTNL